MSVNRIFRFALRGLVGLAVLAAIVWVGDYVSFQYRLSKKTPGNPLESVRVQRTYAIPHKGGQAEYVFGQPEMVTCAHSIFPHAGDPPCWYLEKTSQNPVQM